MTPSSLCSLDLQEMVQWSDSCEAVKRLRRDCEETVKRLRRGWPFKGFQYDTVHAEMEFELLQMNHRASGSSSQDLLLFSVLSTQNM
mmetsp:Transcript_9584/g.11126  ORF Transcript_9584/g.11126 Transcript_9584/m.11126 type:complete len:87 (-) Transcript_9584:310-570(-)